MPLTLRMGQPLRDLALIKISWKNELILLPLDLLDPPNDNLHYCPLRKLHRAAYLQTTKCSKNFDSLLQSTLRWHSKIFWQRWTHAIVGVDSCRPTKEEAKRTCSPLDHLIAIALLSNRTKDLETTKKDSLERSS